LKLLFTEKKNKRIEELDDGGWISDSAFFVDVTGHLNTLNEELQGKDTLITEMFDGIKAFKVKLRFWENQLKVHKLVHFPDLKSLFKNIPGAFFCCERSSTKDYRTSKLRNRNLGCLIFL
jgi:hypothetical protein